MSGFIRMLPAAGWAMVLAAMILTGMGLLGIYAGEAESGVLPANTLRQAAFLAAGLGAMVIVQAIGYRRLGTWSGVLYFVVLLLLALLLVAKRVPLAPFITPRKGSYRWIFLGPLNFQISEIAKLVFIVALAWYLRFRTNYRTIAGLLVPFVLTLVPVALILPEPDLGTSLLLPPTLFLMLFAAGARKRHLALFAGLTIIAAPIFYFSPIMGDYQRKRIQVLLRQNDDDPRWHLNEGYQLTQSKIAVGSGGLVGQGFHEGAFFRHDLLPEEHNDFIFAVLAHQWGFIGCNLVLLCYLVIFVAGLTVATMTTDPFGRLLAVGLCALIFVQTAINISMTIGLAPITGITLPFVSQGGSALVTNYMALGLLISVARRRVIDIARRPFEFTDDELVFDE